MPWRCFTRTSRWFVNCILEHSSRFELFLQGSLITYISLHDKWEKVKYHYFFVQWKRLWLLLRRCHGSIRFELWVQVYSKSFRIYGIWERGSIEIMESEQNYSWARSWPGTWVAWGIQLNLSDKLVCRAFRSQMKKSIWTLRHSKIPLVISNSGQSSEFSHQVLADNKTCSMFSVEVDSTSSQIIQKTPQTWSSSSSRTKSLSV